MCSRLQREPRNATAPQTIQSFIRSDPDVSFAIFQETCRVIVTQALGFSEGLYPRTQIGSASFREQARGRNFKNSIPPAANPQAAVVIENRRPVRSLNHGRTAGQFTRLRLKSNDRILMRLRQPENIVGCQKDHPRRHREPRILKMLFTSRQGVDSVFAGDPDGALAINDDAKCRFSRKTPVHLYLLPMLAIVSRQSSSHRCPDNSVAIKNDDSHQAGRKSITFGKIRDSAVFEKAYAAFVIADP